MSRKGNIPVLILCILIGFAGKPLIGQAPKAFQTQVRQSVIIDSIRIEGNTRTQEALIQSLLEFQKGDTLFLDQLLLSMKSSRFHLYRSNLFSKVGITLIYYKKGHAALLITVNEKPLLSFGGTVKLADRNLTEWWRVHHFSLKRITAGTEIYLNNPFGTGEQFSAYGELGFNQSASIRIILPHFSPDYKWGTEMTARMGGQRILGVKNEENRLVYQEGETFLLKEKMFRMGLSFRPAAEYLFIARLGHFDARAASALLDENPDFFGGQEYLRFLKAELAFRLNRSDHLRYPLNGSDLSFLFSQIGLGSESNGRMSELKMQLSLYQKILPRWYSRNQLQIRFSKGEENNFYLQRAFGYDRAYVRGYELFVITGQHYLITNNELKFHALGIDFLTPGALSRYIRSIPFDIYLKLIADGGVVVNRSDIIVDPMANQLLYSGGIGIDLLFLREYSISLTYSVNNMLQKGIYLQLNW